MELLKKGGKDKIKYPVTFFKRGIYNLDIIKVIIPDPFNLFYKKEYLNVKDRITVLPEIVDIKFPVSSSNRILNTGGINYAHSVGNSEEFRSLREYRYGDSKNKIDYKRFARTMIPVVREYVDEYFTKNGIFLDCSYDMDKQFDFEQAVSLAASFCNVNLGVDTIIELLIVKDRIISIEKGRGLGSSRHMLETLAGISLCGSRGFEKSFHAIKKQLQTLSSLIIIIMDLDENRKKLISLISESGIDYQIYLISGLKNIKGERINVIDPENFKNDLKSLNLSN